MNTTQAGGPAFPNHPDMPVGSPGEGMSLRDYFAAKAMQGYLTQENADDIAYNIIAECAYEMADAMLKARGQ